MSVKVFSTRVDEELRKEFRSIVLRKGSTISAAISQLMQEFVVKETSSISGGNNVAAYIGGSASQIKDESSGCSMTRVFHVEKNMISNLIKSLINDYDYKSAYGLVVKNASMFRSDVIKIVRHAFERSKPNYEEAERLALEAKLSDFLYPVRKMSVKRLCENYLLIKLKSARGEITDMLLRVKPMTEYLALQTLRAGDFDIRKIAVPIFEVGGWRIIGSMVFKNHPDLMAHLKQRYKKYGGFKDSLAGLHLYIHIMDFLKPDKRVIEDFKYFTRYFDLRNKAAHGFGAVTENDLKKEGLDSHTLCEALERVIRGLYKRSIRPEIFEIYDTINARISELLDSQA